MARMYLIAFISLVHLVDSFNYYSPSYQPESSTGSLAGDVQNWASMIQNYISQVKRLVLKLFILSYLLIKEDQVISF